jgi:hypothetical protein
MDRRVYFIAPGDCISASQRFHGPPSNHFIQ